MNANENNNTNTKGNQDMTTLNNTRTDSNGQEFTLDTETSRKGNGNFAIISDDNGEISSWGYETWEAAHAEMGVDSAYFVADLGQPHMTEEQFNTARNAELLDLVERGVIDFHHDFGNVSDGR